ncbi:homogeneously-staining region [Tanacetum coccineum]
MVTMRTILTVSSINNWHVQQLDINNAFFHSDLNEEVYMQVPSGCKKLLPPNIVVAKGHTQQEGIDYTYTFASVAKMVTMRTILIASSINNWLVQQLDINNAFLYGDLNEEVYMQVPSGCKKLLPPNTVFDLLIIPHISHLQALLELSVIIQTQSRILSFSWHPKKQPLSPESSTEAEYRALAYCSCKITWLISLFKDLKVFVPTPVRILCDNISIIALASNPVQHARTKHDELDCHFVREKIKAGQI